MPIDVTPMVCAQIGRLVYDFNFWNPQCREFPLTLVCEEAHEYIPRGDHPRFKQARRIMERIAKNGRKYGVGLVVVSQRPHDVSETVLAQCGTYVCLRITNPNDQDYVRAMVPDAARGVFTALTSLGPGDVCAIPPEQTVSVAPAMSGEASLFRVTNTDDAAGPTHGFHDLPAVLRRGRD